MSSPLVSVIMSAYNAEKYIAKAIESVINQTFTDFEFLITDDYSNDSTAQIIQNFTLQDKRIIFIQNEKNRGFEGYVDNLNNMISLARGKYIAKFDADDIWLLTKLEIQCNYLEKNPETVLISANAYVIDEQDSIIDKIVTSSNQEVIKSNYLKSNPFHHPSIMFRNEEITYRSKMFYHEDYDLYLRLFSSNKKMENFEEILFKYRILKTSLSRNNSNFINYLFKLKTIEFYNQRIQNNNKDEYDSFNPQDFIQINNLNYNSKESDLKLGLKATLVLNDYMNFKIIARKYNRTSSNKLFMLISSFICLNKNTFGLAHTLYSKL
ncbi:glycosyltransferase [Apibacter sp. HY039]|uniref:glycosyltransferase family 2 protein n=1 Tax=Apibacter sp. HY039 TaxID=2501476 RepID=UPI000FEBB525|nr:glycosyltransferase [Apibacter sp. HY039]